MAYKEEKILDGSEDVTASTVPFMVFSAGAMLRGINIGADIPLEMEVAGSWEPVLKAGVAVVMSATGDNPLGIFAAGALRLNAGRDLAANEKVILSQNV